MGRPSIEHRSGIAEYTSAWQAVQAARTNQVCSAGYRIYKSGIHYGFVPLNLEVPVGTDQVTFFDPKLSVQAQCLPGNKRV